MTRSIQLIALIVLIGATYVAASTAHAAPLQAIVVETKDGTTLDVSCESLLVYASGGSVEPQVAPCSGAPSITITGVPTGQVVVDHYDDPHGETHNYGPEGPVDITVTGELVVDGPVTIDGKTILIKGSITASSISILGTGGVNLADTASLTTTGGPIVIDGARVGTVVSADATIDAAGGNIEILGGFHSFQGDVRSAGGAITVLSADGGFTWIEGTIDSSDMSVTGVGGPIVITKGAVFLEPTSVINSSGARGGRNIFVGGNYRGEGDLPTSSSVTVKTGARIDASAVADGDGGDVVIWADELTAYDGDIRTRGGYSAGNGGDVEISSKISLQQAGTIDTSAPNGEDGDILIDPLYYVVMPFPEPLLSGIDDIDHLMLKSGLASNTLTFLYEYICDLFGGDCLPDVIEVGSLDVRYGSMNSVIGALAFFSKHKSAKKDPTVTYVPDVAPKIFQKYKPIVNLARVRGLFSFVSQQTLEEYTGSVSVQSIFGITLAHGLYDSNEVLDFSNQGDGETVTFETMFSIQSAGDIAVGGGDLTLHAGRPFDLGVVEDIIIGAVPFGTTVSEKLDLNDFLHDIDMAPIVRGILMDSFTSDTAGQDVVGFVNLFCENCVPEAVGFSADIYLDPAINFHLIDDVLIALGAAVPGWFGDITQGVSDVAATLPGTKAGDAVDIVLGGYVVPGIPGLELTLCLTGPGGSFGIEDTYPGGSATECWIVPPSTSIPGTVVDISATCNLTATTEGPGECWTTEPIDATYLSHTHTGNKYTHYCSGVKVSSDHGSCFFGEGAHSDGNSPTIHYCGGILQLGSHDCKLTPAIPGIPGVYISAFSECNAGLGTWFRGDCWTIAPSEGEFVTDCYTILPPILGIEQAGQCWSTPPLPIPGICEVDPAIPCSVAELAETTFLPYMIEALEGFVAINTGADFGAFNAMGGIPDSLQIPRFSVDQQAPTVLHVRTITNPDGKITLINGGTGNVKLSETVSGESVVIETNGSVLNQDWAEETNLMMLDFTGVAVQPGSGVIKTGDLKIRAGESVGLGDNPIGLTEAGGEIKLDIESHGLAGVHFESTGAIHVGITSTVTSGGSDNFKAIVLDADDDLAIPDGAVFTTTDSSGGVRFGAGQSGSGGTLDYFGATAAGTLRLYGGSGPDVINLNATASAHAPVGLLGGGGHDTVNFDTLGASVYHDPTNPILHVPSQDSVWLWSTERVNGIAPTLSLIVGQVIGEGTDLAAPYTFVDWGADAWTVTLTDLGTSTALVTEIVTGTPDGLGPFGPRTMSYVFADNGEHDLRLCVTDNGDGGSSCSDFHVSVGNENPTIEAGLDQIVFEGDVVQLDPSTFNDPGTLDMHTANINWGDDTAVDAGLITQSPFGPPGSSSGQNGTVDGSHVYADDGFYTVTVEVTDDDAGVSSDSMTVKVNNAPPVVEAGPDKTTAEGDVFSLAPATFTDPGTMDTHSAIIEWGDGTVTSTVGSATPYGPPGSPLGLSGTVSGSHVYADNGVYTVTVTVTDDDGASHSDSFEVEVSNALPTITPSGEPEVIVFNPMTIFSPFSDPGFDCPDCGSVPPPPLPSVLVESDGSFEDFTATIDWDDGTVEPAIVSEVPGAVGVLTTGTVFGSHSYDWVGTYFVTVTLTDDDGGIASFIHEVEVLGGRSLKIAAIDELIPFTDESKSISDALRELNRLIDWKYWEDEVHPDTKHGHKIFSGEKKAVKKLLDGLRKDRDDDDDDDDLSPEAAAAINEALRFMVTADVIMASIAIDDAEEATVWSPRIQRYVDRMIDEANVEMAKAQADLDNGKFDKAIDHYRRAWENAVRAKILAEPPVRGRGDDND